MNGSSQILCFVINAHTWWAGTVYTSPSCLYHVQLCVQLAERHYLLKSPAIKLLLILLCTYVFAQDKTSLTVAHKLAVAVQATPETGKSKSCVNQTSLCKGFRTSDPQRNVTGQSTERSPLVSMLFSDIPKSLEIFNEHFQYSSTPCILDKQ